MRFQLTVNVLIFTALPVQRISLLLYLLKSDWRVHASVSPKHEGLTGSSGPRHVQGEALAAPDVCSFTGGPLGVSIVFYLKSASRCSERWVPYRLSVRHLKHVQLFKGDNLH